MSAKKPKKKKLSKIPVIHRRLFRLWSEAVRSKCDDKCQYCGVKKGTLNKNDKPIKLDAHHLMNRDVKDCPLKFDIRNGISLCSSCHKFCPNNAFHTNPIVTVAWLKENYPEKYDFVLEHYQLQVNLYNRNILEKIEEKLRLQEHLNLDELIELDKKYNSSESSEED